MITGAPTSFSDIVRVPRSAVTRIPVPHPANEFGVGLLFPDTVMVKSDAD